MIPIITIDGPVSSGKGTVARLVAARLAWHLLDSGALYRVLGLYATRQGVALDDQPALIRLAENLPVPVINPGPLTYKLVETVLALGLTHSRAAYPTPLAPKREMIQAMLAAAAKVEGGS